MTISRHNLLKLGLVTVTAGVVGAACSDDTSVRPLGPFSGEGGGTGTGGSGSASGGAKGNTGGTNGNTGGKATGSGGSGTGTGGANGNTGGKSTGGTSSGTGGANSNTGGKGTGGANGNTGGTSTGGANGNTGGKATGGANGNTGGNSGSVTCNTVMATIGTNHAGAEHMVDPAITSDDVMAAVDASYDLSEGGDPPHTHSITVTAADFAKLAQGMTVMVTSDNVEGHTHVVTLKCGA